MSQDVKNEILSCLLTAIFGGAGIMSTLDHVEQLGRIILLFISIVSGIFLILVNWNKATVKLKELFKIKQQKK
jgi:hypothetical protein